MLQDVNSTLRNLKNFFNRYFNAQFVTADIIVISVYLKLSTLFAVSHFLSVKVLPEWKLSLSFEIQRKSPFNGGSR